MKIQSFVSVSLFFIGLFYLSGCKKDSPKINEKPIAIDARFVSDKTDILQGDLVNFFDSTQGFPLKWKWYFEGGSPSTSAVQNPKNITYSDTGSFYVKLVVSNAYSSDSVVRTNFIRVGKKEGRPIINTIEASNIESRKANVGGELIYQGLSDVIQMGVCWDTTINPKFNDMKAVASTTELGEFIVEMNNLELNKNYYYRAYAINSDGVAYGKQMVFSTIDIDSCDFWLDKFVDPRDGNEYRYITAAGHTWMGDNLNFNTDGSWCYNDLESNCEKYGRLYTIESAKNACPAGWRLPSIEDWNSLLSTLGQNSGTQLKNKNVWYSGSASNEICFSALPAGYKNLDSDIYSTQNFFGYWWSSSINNEGLNKVIHISYSSNSVDTIAYENNFAFSVRCVKN